MVTGEGVKDVIGAKRDRMMNEKGKGAKQVEQEAERMQWMRDKKGGEM